MVWEIGELYGIIWLHMAPLELDGWILAHLEHVRFFVRFVFVFFFFFSGHTDSTHGCNFFDLFSVSAVAIGCLW